MPSSFRTEPPDPPPDPPPVLALTGATGYVGRYVAAMADRAGWQVRALARAGSDRSGFDQPVAWVTGRFDDPTAQQALVTGADALVHAGFEHVPGRYRGGEGDDLDGFLSVNLMGSLRLLH